MNRPLRIVNVSAVCLLAAYMGYLVGNSFAAGQPLSVTCYTCKACSSQCVLGIDPQGFWAQSLANDPRMYIYATNIRLSAGRALALDPEMIVTLNGRHLCVREAMKEPGITADSELMTYRMQARHAALFCLDCGACEKVCPLKLPLLQIIRQLRTDCAAEDSP